MSDHSCRFKRRYSKSHTKVARQRSFASRPGSNSDKANPAISYRVLFSAHGLPKRVVDRGDPYQWQVERTVEAVLSGLRAAKA